MASNLIRFEIVLPNVDTGSPHDLVIQNFITNMLTLCQMVMYTAYIYAQNGSIAQQNVLYGLISSAQQSTALGYLNSLNSGLGSSVLCTVSAVTQEP